MNSLGHRLLWPVTLMVALVFLAACAKRVELEVNAKPTYIGPQVADSTNIRLTDSWGWDYKVNMTCMFTNSGGPGRVNVLATVAQGDKSWERRTLLQTRVGQRMTAEFEFAEPTFNWMKLIAPLVSVVLGDWGGIASAFLGGDAGSGIRGSCQAYPNAADMKVRLDCIVTNVGEGSGSVTVRGVKNGNGQTSEVAIGPKEQKTVPFVFQVESEDDRFECHAE